MNSLLICDDCHPAEAAALCARYNCGIEIQSFYDPAYLVGQPDGIDLYQPLVADIRLRALHGPFGDLCPGSFDIMVRDLARYRFEQAARIADELGATHLILHHGYTPGTSDRKNWILRCTSFWRQFVKDRPTGMRVYLENHLERDPSMLADLIDAVDDPRLDLCLDIGHVHGCIQGDVVEWIKQLGTHIGYVHLHDNHGSRDEHLGLGRGNAPLEEIVAALRQYSPNALWALECKLEEMVDSIEWLENHS